MLGQRCALAPVRFRHTKHLVRVGKDHVCSLPSTQFCHHKHDSKKTQSLVKNNLFCCQKFSQKMLLKRPGYVWKMSWYLLEILDFAVGLQHVAQRVEQVS